MKSTTPQLKQQYLEAIDKDPNSEETIEVMVDVYIALMMKYSSEDEPTVEDEIISDEEQIARYRKLFGKYVPLPSQFEYERIEWDVKCPEELV